MGGRVLSMVAVLVFVFPASGLGDVDLLFDPAAQTVVLEPDAMIAIHLVARSSDGTAEPITALDAILDWDPLALELLGIDDADAGHTWFVSAFLNDPDGINAGIDTPPEGVPANDGDALYTALAGPEDPGITGPDDLVVTTVLFRPLQETAETTVSFLPSVGQFGQTRVFGEGIQNDVTGDISASATIQIVAGCNESCPTDIDGSSDTGAFDLATLLGCWGPVSGGTCACLDADSDDMIGPFDLASLLGSWGDCP